MRFSFVLILLTLTQLVWQLLGQSCWAYRSDELALTTQGGGSLLSQSFEVSRHFYQEDEYDQNFFLKERLDQDEDGPKPLFRQTMPLSWNFGLNYTRLAVPVQTENLTLVENTYSAQAGLDWDIQKNLDFEIKALVRSIPAESYRHGRLTMRFEYMLAFPRQKKKSAKVEEDPDLDGLIDEERVATEYYKKLREKNIGKLDERVRYSIEELRVIEGEEIEAQAPEEKFPNLKLAFNLGFSTHFIEAKTFVRRPQLGSLSDSVYLYQNGLGPEFIYSPSFKYSVRIKAMGYFYINDMKSFLNGVEVGPAIQSVTAASIVDPFLALPQFSFGESFEWYRNDRDTYVLSLSQTIAASPTQGAFYRVYPEYIREMGERWKLGVGVGATIFKDGSNAVLGAVDLNYRL